MGFSLWGPVAVAAAGAQIAGAPLSTHALALCEDTRQRESQSVHEPFLLFLRVGSWLVTYLLVCPSSSFNSRKTTRSTRSMATACTTV